MEQKEDSPNQSKVAEYETLLHKIPGIIASKIIFNDSNEIIELHILADVLRGPKQIVRDVQSALAAKFNIVLDHKVISIAQIEDGKVSLKNYRFHFEYIRSSFEGNKIEVTVGLSKDGQLFEGTAIGGVSINGRLRVVAEAVLNGVHAFLNIQYAFVLADIQKITIAGKHALAVSIGHISEIGEELLIGSSFINRDENDSIVRATLDAINRRVMRYYVK